MFMVIKYLYFSYLKKIKISNVLLKIDRSKLKTAVTVQILNITSYLSLRIRERY